MASRPAGDPRAASDEAAHLFATYRALIDAALDRALPAAEEPPAGLHEAMRYSVFAGGKRLRPILVLAAAEAAGDPAKAAGGGPESLLPAACAVELIHTYSLIHDDLPAFDDDDLRRGKPTSHKVFGEPQAILTGDALQSAAFSLLAGAARDTDAPGPWIDALVELAAAAGSVGMAAGQWLDIEAEGQPIDMVSLEALHAAKTGALLTACVRIGALLAGADDATLERLRAYGRAVCLAFQIVDDILDVEGSVENLGKLPGVDADRDKATYPGLLGLDGARSEARRLRDLALRQIEPLGASARPLALIANFIVDRSQ
ncbi:MAG: polyprenyl synthetase family protein [Acidobacteria bacterium]|nr:polyprenyl synthetase family protein [Acidobacteriota bacterium]